MPVNSSLTPTTVAMIIGTVLLLGVGQVLFKFAASGLQFSDVRSYFSLPLLAALTIYGFATLAWLAVLSRVPLSSAFPFYGLGFIFVPLLSIMFLGEAFRWSTFVGGVIIMLGIVISAQDW